jgi:prophage regulatory protein
MLAALPVELSSSPNPLVRRQQLRELVPLADTTIYEMEQRGEFPKRFYLTPRCPVWDLGEINLLARGTTRGQSERSCRRRTRMCGGGESRPVRA